MADRSKFESVPDELLLSILSFLEPEDTINLQVQSKRLLKICRDNNLWRSRCLLESSFLGGINVRRGLHFSDGSSGDPLMSAALAFQDNSRPETGPSLPVNYHWRSSRALREEKKRIAANWDPTFKDEQVSWYDEYIQRHGPISVSWFEQPRVQNRGTEEIIETKGVAVFRPNLEADELFAVSPLDDGSICLLDIKGTRAKKGSILSKTVQGTLYVDSPRATRRPKMATFGGTDSVSVDSQRKRAFFADQSHLVEVDLETLQVVGNQPYEWTITSLSTAHPELPLTVGTLHGIHLHDSRKRSDFHGDRGERLDGSNPFGLKDLSKISKIWDSKPLPPYAPLAQSGPLGIVHLELAGSKGLISDDIFVAGRFSSILHYDRRMFPAIKGSLHSGSRVSSITSLPYPFSSIDSELRRRGELSQEQVDKAKTTPGGRTLIACGEYNTKGSLEIYGLSSQSSNLPHGGSTLLQNATMKNRQTASSSKLLSVINHGTRILFSDGQGCLKWVERDGFTEVRSHVIGHPEKTQHPSLFASMPGSGEIARKLLSTQTGNMNANNDDVLFWTGEKLGLVGFSTRPTFSAGDFDDNTKTPEEIAIEMAEEQYSEKMRLALERQANDVRFVRYLGAGIRDGI